MSTKTARPSKSKSSEKRALESAPSLCGPERLAQICAGGVTGERISIPVRLDLLETRAKEILKPEAYDYVAGGAGGESTIRANLAAFERWRLVPRMFRNVAQRDLTTELLGKKISAPILLAPVGVQGIIHPEAEVATARAAASLGVPMVLSTVCSRPMEEVTRALNGTPGWFQLYWSKDQELAASFVRRAEAAGFGAIVVTLDIPMLAWRERDLQHAYLPFLHGDGVANYFCDPVFCSRLKVSPREDPQAAIVQWTQCFAHPALTWKDLKFLRQQTKLPILLKGIMHAEDARLALKHGVDGVIVSNHGGRQVDGGLAALDALAEIVKAVRGRVPVVFDSGIRRGADVLKALALGAKAVLVGRPYIWGLAVAGEEGVRDVVRNLVADFDITMALCGCTSVKQITKKVMVRSE